MVEPMILEISDLVVKSIVEPKFFGRTKDHAWLSVRLWDNG